MSKNSGLPPKPLLEEEIKEILRGSYREEGVEKWFQRPRTWLDGRTPQQVLDDYEQLSLHVQSLLDAGLAT